MSEIATGETLQVEPIDCNGEGHFMVRVHVSDEAFRELVKTAYLEYCGYPLEDDDPLIIRRGWWTERDCEPLDSVTYTFHDSPVPGSFPVTWEC